MKRRMQLLIRGLIAFSIILPAASVQAQALRPASGINFGLGYVANAPDVLSGVQVMAIEARGWGLFGDVIADLRSPADRDDFLPGVTPDQAVQEFGDFRFQQESVWRSVNFGVIRAVTSELAVYGGGGLTTRSVYAEFNDPSGERGTLGSYWIRDDERSNRGIAAVGGLYFVATPRILFQFGGSSYPAAVRIGATYMFSN